MSVKYCLLVPVFYFWRKLLMHPAAQSLCDSWATCSVTVTITINLFNISCA